MMVFSVQFCDIKIVVIQSCLTICSNEIMEFVQIEFAPHLLYQNSKSNYHAHVTECSVVQYTTIIGRAEMTSEETPKKIVSDQTLLRAT